MTNRHAVHAVAERGNPIGYNLLVATIFAGCLPVAVARSVAAIGRASPSHGPLSAALETAHCAAAQAYSLPG